MCRSWDSNSGHTTHLSRLIFPDSYIFFLFKFSQIKTFTINRLVKKLVLISELHNEKLSSDLITNITDLLHYRKSIREIAKIIGRSKTTNSRYLKKMASQVPQSKIGRLQKLLYRDKWGIAWLRVNSGPKTAVGLTKRLHRERGQISIRNR